MDDATAKTAGEALLKNPQFLEMFQRAMGDEKMPEEGDPKREQWLKNLQKKLSDEAEKETQRKLETPVTDEEGEWMWIVPEAGFCIKAGTEKRDKKVFINICKHARIAEPMPIAEEDAEPEMKDAVKFRIPLSCGAARPDSDKKGSPCVVYDVIVNPKTIERCGQDNEFRRFVAALCLSWIKQKSEPQLDADQFTNINIKCKGQPQMQRIRLSHPAAGGNRNAMQDEIKLPGQKGAASAPNKAATSVSKPLIMEIVPDAPKPTSSVKHEGNYDWSRHKQPTKNSFFREVVPKFLDVTMELPGITTIKELEVNLVGRHLKLIGDAPYYEVALPFPVTDTPETSKFVRSTGKLTLRLVVELPDEIVDEERRRKEHAASLDAETEEERKKRLEHEKLIQERRERLDRIEREERDIMEQRKSLVENMSAMQEGRLPPTLQKEIDEMPPEQARSMMMRIENKVRRGDSIDDLMDKLPEDALENVVLHIRQRLGLAVPEKAKAKNAAAAKAADEAAPPAAEMPKPVEYNFAKKAEQLCGVKLENRFVFALEH
jgi:hypothetical protein